MRHALHCVAGLAVSGLAAAQDLQIDICDTTEAGLYVIRAEFFGSLPTGTDRIGAIWLDSNFSLTGDAPISYTGYNPGYQTDFFGGPEITGDGSTATSFVGTQGFEILGDEADPSNPLYVAAFRYEGSLGALSLQLTGQNSSIFYGNPAEPFGTVQLYQDAQGNAGTLSFNTRIRLLPWNIDPDEFSFFVPAPGSSVFVCMGLLAASRRRR